MKKIRFVIIMLVLFSLSSCSLKPIVYHTNGNSSVISSLPTVSSKSETATDTNYFYSDIKAVWISYLELEPILKDKTQSEFEASFEKMMKNSKELGLNTVIVHTVPFSDTLYESKYYPRSTIWTTNNNPKVESPLKTMVELAHKYKLSFHAWVNPLRGVTKDQAKMIDDSVPIKKIYNDKLDKASVVKDRLYLNPAYEDVRSIIADVVGEIVSGYDVDAVHIDDYFYPTTAKSFDKISFNKLSNSMTLSEFRINNCNLLVKAIYNIVHKANNKVKFGISPQGNVDNNYTSQYADVRRWCAEKGYADYIMPQIYYGFNNETSPFKKVATQWEELVQNEELILTAGLACHKINMVIDAYAGSGKSEWSKSDNIIANQIEYIDSLKSYSGFALYSYKSVFSTSAKKEKENIKDILKQRVNS